MAFTNFIETRFYLSVAINAMFENQALSKHDLTQVPERAAKES